MSRSTKGQTRECSVRIVDAVRILNEEQWRVRTFLECLSPDGIIIITIVVCSCKRNVEEGSTGELSIEIDAVPSEVKIETIGKLRTVWTTYKALVITVDLTVTVKVNILDVADIRTSIIPC